MNPSRFSPLLLLAGAPAWLYSHPANAEAATRWTTAVRQHQAQNWPAARAGYAQLVALGLGVGWRGLGLLRELGDPERDWARDCYERARAAGDDCGHWLIGNLHRRGGPGLVQDATEARRWYERGLAAGHGDNGFFLGLLYEVGGPGLPADWARARDSYAAYAAGGGAPEIYGYIAALYEQGGPNLPRDLDRARYYRRRAVGLTS